MANKARGFGLTAELDKKKAGKFNADRANEALGWFRDVLHQNDPNDSMLDVISDVNLMEEVQTILKDGVILCKVMNIVYPGSVKRINTNKMAFKQMENISNFLGACEKQAGVQKSDLFQTVDLYEAGNIPVVIECIYALGRKQHSNTVTGPLIPGLGPKEAEKNTREFTEEQLNEGKNVIGLQMGTNKLASQAGQNFGKTRAIID